MNLHNLLNSTTEFEQVKAQYFTAFELLLYFWGINLAMSRLNQYICCKLHGLDLYVVTYRFQWVVCD